MAESKEPVPPVWVRWGAAIIRRLPAGRYRAMNWLCRRPSPVFVMRMLEELGGYSFTCDLRDSISREVCFAGRYEPQETALVRAILRPGMTFVDVGANWGYFTLLAAHLVGTGGRVVSLEPDPRLFRMLHENVVRNSLTRVTALQVAAAAEAGTLTLAGYNESDGNFGISRVVSGGQEMPGTFQVAARSLDALFDELGVRDIDLLKMDIEGAEGFALPGSAKSLANRGIHRLLLELHPARLAEHGHSAQDIIQHLLGVGYRAWTVDHSHAGSRRAVYARRLNPRTLLRPLNTHASLDDWPHLLWTMPGMEPLP